MAARPTAGDALRQYRTKRDFSKTREPAGAGQAAGERLFVVQKHAARRLHYDLRMQFGDTLRSWAVPQGPSLDPKVRRLAVHVEDHPLAYADFEGPIPKGQYGAGAMIVWDRGTWVPMGDPEADYQKGTLKFRLSGEKLGGGWTLVRIRKPQERGDNWLLIKERDPYAKPEAEGNILEEAPESVISGRGVEEVAADQPQAEPRKAKQKPRPVRVAKLAGARPGALPASLRPQLASPSASVPEGDDWLHEIKLDGYRTLARIEDDAVRLFTRQGHDWTDRYGSLAGAFAKISCRQALIDGEIVVQDEAGISRFSALQDALAEGRSHELTFFAFDLLHLDSYDLTAVPLRARKQALDALLAAVAEPTAPLQLSSHIEGHGPDFLAQASRMGLEGVISKRADAHYRPGRSKTWLKTKCLQSDEFLIVGFAESPAAGGLGALLLAEAQEDGTLRYVGRVGTGYSAGEADRLHARLQALRQDQPPVDLPPAERRKAVWVRPALQVEVHYGSRTADGILRHAVYKGLRADKAAPVNSAPKTPRQRWVSDEDLASVWVTNPDRRMFGADGPSKLELALYYAQVGDWMLPELSLRPVSLVRCPTGKAADCFFQRHARSGMPEAIRQISLREEGSKERADYLYVENARGLLALSQFGAVELHSWGCRVDKPERPDRMVFDLDPDEGLPWRQVVEAAFVVRESLEDLGFTPFVKTTGGKGLHVVVALARRQAWPEVRRFAEAFAVDMARRLPKLFTANMAKSSRRGRIYLDYLRNGRSATAVAAWSLRARPGVPVSTPLAWHELSDIDDPADLNYSTVPRRLTEVADPWAELAESARPLTKEMERRLQAGR